MSSVITYIVIQIIVPVVVTVILKFVSILSQALAPAPKILSYVRLASNRIFGPHGCKELPTRSTQFEEIFAMLIFVNTTGKTITLNAKASDTIDKLKAENHDKEEENKWSGVKKAKAVAAAEERERRLEAWEKAQRRRDKVETAEAKRRRALEHKLEAEEWKRMAMEGISGGRRGGG